MAKSKDKSKKSKTNLNTKKKLKVKNVPIADIVIPQRIRDDAPDDLQPHIDDLIHSIGNPNVGLLNPLTVAKNKDDKIELLAGYCRLKALEHLEWETAPCIFKSAKLLREQRQIEMEENSIRKDFRPSQKAKYAIWAIEKERKKQKKLKRKGTTSKIEPQMVIAKQVGLGKTTLNRCITIWKSENQELIDHMDKDSISAAWHYGKNKGILGKKSKPSTKENLDKMKKDTDEDDDLDEISLHQKNIDSEGDEDETPDQDTYYNKHFIYEAKKLPASHLAALEHWQFREDIKKLMIAEFESEKLEYSNDFLNDVIAAYWGL